MTASLYRLRSYLRAAWPTVLGLAAVVGVLGAVVLTLVSGTARTLSAPDRATAAQPVDFDATIEQSGGNPRTDEIAALPAVRRAESATFVFGGIAPKGTSPAHALDALVFAGSDAAVGTRLVEGRDPRADRPGEFVALRSLVKSEGLSMGDHFDLWVIPASAAAERGFDAQDEAYRLLRATLVGVVDGPATDDYTVVLFPPALLDVGDVGVSATNAVVALRGDSTIAQLRTQLDSLPDGTELGIGPAQWVSTPLRDGVRVQGQGFAILATIAAVATAVAVGQVLSSQSGLADVDRASLQAVGMRRAQLVAEPLLRAAVPVVLGAVLAVGLAFACSGLFPVGFARRVEPDPGLRFAAVPLIVGAIALVVVLVGWVAVASVLSSRERRPAPNAAVEGVARRVPVGTAMGLRFAFTRQSREAGRPRARAAGAVVVLAIMVGALTFGASLAHLVDDPARWGNDFDLGVGQGGELAPEVVDQLARDPDVGSVTVFATVVGSVGSRAFDVTGARTLRGSNPMTLFEGRPPARPDEMVIGRVDARRYHVGVGDHLDIVGTAGTRRYRISAIGVLPSIEGADGLGEGGLVTLAGLRRLDPSATPSAAGLRLRRGPPLDVARRLSAETGVAIGPTFTPPDTILNLGRVRSVPYVVAGVLALLAVVTLAHGLAVSTWRRRHELAVLRAMGASGRLVTRVVHWQATLFTAVVLAAAVPVGIIVGRLIFRAFAGRIGAVETVTVPLGLIVGAAVALFVLANIVAIPSALRCRKRSAAALLVEE